MPSEGDPGLNGPVLYGIWASADTKCPDRQCAHNQCCENRGPQGHIETGYSHRPAHDHSQELDTGKKREEETGHQSVTAHSTSQEKGKVDQPCERHRGVLVASHLQLQSAERAGLSPAAALKSYFQL